jgi:hypothetical protein
MFFSVGNGVMILRAVGMCARCLTNESLTTVNLCLVTVKYKNPSCTIITVPQKYVFDFKK